MNKKTQTRKKSSQTVQKAPGLNFGSPSFYKLVTGGILVSTSVLLISLFAYFKPNLLSNIAAEAYETIQTKLAEPDAGNNTGGGSGLADGGQNNGGLAKGSQMNGVSDGSQISGGMADGSQINGGVADGSQVTGKLADGNQTDGSQGESVPYLVSSSELGDISDLSLEDNYENQLSAYSVMLDTALGPMLYYNQGDVRWGDYLYGGEDPMKTYGCGPTAVSMIINSFSPDCSGVTPVNLADWAAANGEYAPKGGSYHSLIPNSLSAYGLDVGSVKKRTVENVSNLLSTGHILVALMGKGALTDNGHFILITKLLDNGNVYIADPNSYTNSTKEWSLEQLLSELKGSNDSGGPLWSVSMAQG